MQEKHVLVASPIRQKPPILEAFLASLKALDKTNCRVSYLFYDDNEQPRSSRLLERFEHEEEDVTIRSYPQSNAEYECDEVTHYWKEELVWRVAAMKNECMQQAVRMNADAIFLLDSDLLVHPDTMIRLLQSNKEIISNIFWTVWEPGSMELPQVWIQDTYTLIPQRRNEELTEEEAKRRLFQLVAKLRQPGIYEVGGLGACTLIRTQAIRAGLSFSEIPNLSFWGEDRHFCIRAAALGFSLFVDTRKPAYHIYRESDLAGVRAFFKAAGIEGE